MALWESAGRDLETAGATVIEVDFPIVSNYEGDRAGAPTINTRGLVPEQFLHNELNDLAVWAWDDFLKYNGDSGLSRLTQFDRTQIFPQPPGALPDRYDGFDDHLEEFPRIAAENRRASFTEIPKLGEGIAGLEETRRIDFDQWMAANHLDAVVFPAVADVGPADMDVNEASANLGWRNGVWVANGNLAIRHFGIPTITVPMGLMSDIGMPVGLTFAGPPYSDLALLRLAAAFEQTGTRRTAPPRTPVKTRLAAAKRCPRTRPNGHQCDHHLRLHRLADDTSSSVSIDARSSTGIGRRAAAVADRDN